MENVEYKSLISRFQVTNAISLQLVTVCSSREAPVKPLSVDLGDAVCTCSVEELALVVSSVVFVHLLLSKLVGLVKMWVLYPLNAQDGQIARSLIKFYFHIPELSRRRQKFHRVNSDFMSGLIARHWVPVTWKRVCYKIKTYNRPQLFIPHSALAFCAWISVICFLGIIMKGLQGYRQ